MSQGPTFFYEDPDFRMRQLSDEAFQIFSGVCALAAGDKDDSGHALNIKIRKTTSLLKKVFKASRAGVTTFFFFFCKGPDNEVLGLVGDIGPFCTCSTPPCHADVGRNNT